MVFSTPSQRAVVVYMPYTLVRPGMVFEAPHAWKKSANSLCIQSVSLTFVFMTAFCVVLQEIVYFVIAFAIDAFTIV